MLFLLTRTSRENSYSMQNKEKLGSIVPPSPPRISCVFHREGKQDERGDAIEKREETDEEGVAIDWREQSHK